MDEIGQVFIIDRRKDMMNTAGFKVFPTGCRMLKGSSAHCCSEPTGRDVRSWQKLTASAANRWSTDFG
jgi:hypothetical protein